jgi:hypothetical protein
MNTLAKRTVLTGIGDSVSILLEEEGKFYFSFSACNGFYKFTSAN